MRVVLGGGIGGLAAAHYLCARFPTQAVSIYEAGPELGGWLRSTQLADGSVLEQGPRTLRPKGVAAAHALQFVDELGLAGEIRPVAGSHPAARNRFIFCNGQLHALPSTISKLFTTTSPFSKPLVRFLLQDLWQEQHQVQQLDESIYSFVERRFGDEIAKYIISPLICGICAGDAKEISVKFLLKSMFEREQKYGGVIKGYVYDVLTNRGRMLPLRKEAAVPTTLVDVARRDRWHMYTFAGGMSTLVHAAQRKLATDGVDVLLQRPCDKLDFCDGSAVLTVAGMPQEAVARHVVSCIPAGRLAGLVRHQHPQLAALLQTITSVTVAVVNLHYSTQLGLDQAFGFLVPPVEGLPLLGVIYDSCLGLNTATSSTVLTVMMGGRWFHKHFGPQPTQQHLLDVAVTHLQQILNIQVPPDNYQVQVLENCIPQYTVGHYDRLDQIQQYIRTNNLPLSICGASYYGIGINDVIYSSKIAIDQIPL